MKIKIKTEVEGNYRNIAAGFDLQLFEYLVPPFTKVKIKEFTGSKKGDRVHVQFIFPTFELSYIKYTVLSER